MEKPGTEEEAPSHPSLHANTRARFTDVSWPSSCAAKASVSVVWPHGAWSPGRAREAVCCGSCLNVLPIPEESPPAVVLHERRSFFFLRRKGWLLQRRQEGARQRDGGGHSVASRSQCVRVSAPFSGPNLICRLRSLIHTHYDNDWQDL